MASQFETVTQEHARAREMVKQLLKEESNRFALTYATTILSTVILNNVSDHDFAETDKIVDCFHIQLKVACRQLYAARLK